MIVGSIGLVLLAAVLLVVGAIRSDAALYYSSIVTSALAALALIVGVRQFPAGQLPDPDFDVRPGRPGPGTWPPRPIGRAGVPPQSRAQSPAWPPPVVQPAGPPATGSLIEDAADLDADATDLAVPADEPGIQAAAPAALTVVATLTQEVIVIDGRPRYHVAACLHLLGREEQRLPVREAVEFGFTPCALCEPVTVLLAQNLAQD